MKTSAPTQTQHHNTTTATFAPAVQLFQTRPFAAQQNTEHASAPQSSASALFGTYLQRKATDTASTEAAAPARANNTDLPDQLKAGIENLSGYAMDNVNVHYNSPKPAQLFAHAYTQGTDIHIAPGQERHLPHEAWHVVQQMQGRVRPTMQLKGIGVNDDAGLEHEASVMGEKSFRMKSVNTIGENRYKKKNSTKQSKHNSNLVLQLWPFGDDKDKATGFFTGDHQYEHQEIMFSKTEIQELRRNNPGLSVQSLNNEIYKNMLIHRAPFQNEIHSIFESGYSKVDLPFFGPIYTYKNDRTQTITNNTMKGHLLHKGFVTRQTVLDNNGNLIMKTNGSGSGRLPLFNNMFKFIWSNPNKKIRNSVYNELGYKHPKRDLRDDFFNFIS